MNITNWEDIKNYLSSVRLGHIALISVLSALLMLLVCFIVIKILLRVIDKLLKRSNIESALKSFIRSLAKIVLWIIAFIVIADKLKINITSFVALLSVVGLALSLSIQSILSNLFSGFTLMSTKPFSSGDFVELDSVNGMVSEVGIFYTTIRTYDNKLIYIPNAEVASAKIINYTRQGTRRVDLKFCASYEDSTEKVKKALHEAIDEDNRILKDPAPFVGLSSYKESSIEYELRAWTENEDYWDVYYNLLESTREKFSKHGVTMTYEHINVHMIND